MSTCAPQTHGLCWAKKLKRGVGVTFLSHCEALACIHTDATRRATARASPACSSSSQREKRATRRLCCTGGIWPRVHFLVRSGSLGFNRKVFFPFMSAKALYPKTMSPSRHGKPRNGVREHHGMQDGKDPPNTPFLDHTAVPAPLAILHQIIASAVSSVLPPGVAIVRICDKKMVQAGMTIGLI